MLQFLKFDTECSWDYVFVYDGSSYQAPLLAALSGSTLDATPIIASASSVSCMALASPIVRPCGWTGPS